MLKSIVSAAITLALTAILTAYAAARYLPGRISNEMQTTSDKCLFWRSRVDASVTLPDGHKELDEKDQQNTMDGIECLLNLEGNKNAAKFSGANKPYISQIFKQATVEVAALYYISYLYTQKWDHADAIFLANDNEEAEEAETTRRAYEAYRVWYKEVKKVGIVKAREKRLNPLKGTGIRWY